MQYAEQDAENAVERMTKKVKKQVATQNLAAARLAGKGKIELEKRMKKILIEIFSRYIGGSCEKDFDVFQK